MTGWPCTRAVFRRQGTNVVECSPLISAAELAAILQRDDVCVIDCRFDLQVPTAGREAWLEAHIPGAVYADLDTDLAGPISASTGRHPLPDPKRFEETLGRWGIDNETEVVVYDAGSGAIAARAWWMMHWLGHSAVRLLDGGFEAWRDGGNVTESGAVRRSPAHFSGRVRDDLVITTAEVVAGMASGSPVTLLDARDAARFRGEVEPIDPVAGHIPGAINVPFSGSLSATGRFRAPGELARRLAGALASGAGHRCGVMCGSGVTACHLALAAVLAGLDMPRLYVGSWSEWISDPARPVETGA